MNRWRESKDIGIFSKLGVGDDDPIPVAGGNAAEKARAFGRLEIFLARDQDVRRWIEGEQLTGELFEHVVGHDVHGLLRQAQAL